MRGEVGRLADCVGLGGGGAAWVGLFSVLGGGGGGGVLLGLDAWVGLLSVLAGGDCLGGGGGVLLGLVSAGSRCLTGPEG